MTKKYSFLAVAQISSILLLNACSSGENLQSKMGRYTPKASDKNIIPEIKSFSINFSNNEKGRMPASNAAMSIEKETNFTNKKLYFLSLVDQYEKLKNYSFKSEAPKISICPNFHSGLLTHYQKTNSNNPDKMANEFKYSLSEIHNADYLGKHPELYLPITKDSTMPRIVDILKSKPNQSPEEVNKLVQTAINVHLTKTYYEISELCEYGSSDNYYIYENLMTHTKSTNFPASEVNLNILLKSTLFVNMAIINSLGKQKPIGGRTIASQKEVKTNYTNEVMNKMNVNWAQEYFAKLRN